MRSTLEHGEDAKASQTGRKRNQLVGFMIGV
jgi:hypothetical protein